MLLHPERVWRGNKLVAFVGIGEERIDGSLEYEGDVVIGWYRDVDDNMRIATNPATGKDEFDDDTKAMDIVMHKAVELDDALVA